MEGKAGTTSSARYPRSAPVLQSSTFWRARYAIKQQKFPACFIDLGDVDSVVMIVGRVVGEREEGGGRGVVVVVGSAGRARNGVTFNRLWTTDSASGRPLSFELPCCLWADRKAPGSGAQGENSLRDIEKERERDGDFIGGELLTEPLKRFPKRGAVNGVLGEKS